MTGFCRFRRSLLPRILALPSLAALSGALLILAGWAPSPFEPRPKLAAFSGMGVDFESATSAGMRILDSRGTLERSAGMIPGAQPFDEADWEQSLGDLLLVWEGEPILIYCQDEHCGTGPRLAAQLREALDFDQVFYLRGGFVAWKRMHP